MVDLAATEVGTKVANWWFGEGAKRRLETNAIVAKVRFNRSDWAHVEEAEMAQLFPSYANTLIRAGIVGAILGAHGLAAAALIFLFSFMLNNIN